MDIIVFGVSLCKYVLFFFPFFFRVWQTSQIRLPRSPGEESLVMEGAMMGGYEEAQGDYGGVGMDEYVCERERREGRVCVDGPSTCHTGWRSQPTSEWFWVNNVPAHVHRATHLGMLWARTTWLGGRLRRRKLRACSRRRKRGGSEPSGRCFISRSVRWSGCGC